MKAASLCLISPVRGSSLAASNLSMKHFILVPQRPSTSGKYFYAFYIFSYNIFLSSPILLFMDLNWKLRCTLALMAQPWSTHCTLMVVFSVKLFPVTFSRHFFMGGVSWQGFQQDPGILSPGSSPLSRLELESFSFWLSRAVNALTQGRHSGWEE